MDNEIIKTKLLVTITDKGKEEKALRLYKRHKVTYSISINGIGTASSSLMDYFGLNEIKKNVILSVIPEKLETKLLYDLQEKLEVHKPGEGIAFTIGITSATRYLSNQYSGIKIMEEEYTVSKEKEYELIVLIVLEGYSTLAMDAAKRIGVSGGTLIHGIGLGSKEAKKFLGITIEPEKDVVLILTEKEHKKDVMKEITEAVGLSKEGRGICFSLPVDHAVGLSEKIKFEKKVDKNDKEK